MKKNKKILFVIAGALLIVIAIATYYFADKYKFVSVDHNINNYVTSIKQSKNIESISSEKYCSYAHQKYSKGSLGCAVNYTFYNTRKDIITADFDNKATKFGWTYSFDNTDGNNKYSEQKYILSRVYKYKNITCGLHITEDGQKYKYQIGCSGPAKAEWFPVRS